VVICCHIPTVSVYTPVLLTFGKHAIQCSVHPLSGSIGVGVVGNFHHIYVIRACDFQERRYDGTQGAVVRKAGGSRKPTAIEVKSRTSRRREAGSRR